MYLSLPKGPWSSTIGGRNSAVLKQLNCSEHDPGDQNSQNIPGTGAQNQWWKAVVFAGSQAEPGSCGQVTGSTDGRKLDRESDEAGWPGTTCDSICMCDMWIFSSLPALPSCSNVPSPPSATCPSSEKNLLLAWSCLRCLPLNHNFFWNCCLFRLCVSDKSNKMLGTKHFLTLLYHTK